MYGHLPPITKTIPVTRTSHAEHCRRSREELISDILLLTPSHGQAKVGRPARTYIQHLCADTGCSLEDGPEAMDDSEGWSGKSVLMVRYDDDDDVCLYLHICVVTSQFFFGLFLWHINHFRLFNANCGYYIYIY